MKVTQAIGVGIYDGDFGDYPPVSHTIHCYALIPVPTGDKGRIGLYMKLCNFTLLFMILQVELRLNKDH